MSFANTKLDVKEILRLTFWGAWVAQSVKHLTLAQVMISRFVGLSPTSGSVLTAQSLDPASDSVSPPSPRSLKNKHKKKKKQKTKNVFKRHKMQQEVSF